jgi:hypothetical protein
MNTKLPPKIPTLESAFQTPKEVIITSFKPQTLDDILIARGLTQKSKNNPKTNEGEEPEPDQDKSQSNQRLSGAKDKAVQPDDFFTYNPDGKNNPEYHANEFTNQLIFLIVKKDVVTTDKAAQIIGAKLKKARPDNEIKINDLDDWNNFLAPDMTDETIDALTAIAIKYGMDQQVAILRSDWLKHWTSETSDISN